MVMVSHTLSISQATVTVAVDRLMKKELMMRELCPEDRRTKCLTLTEKGEAYLQENQSRHGALLRSIEGALGEEDSAQFVRILHKVNDYLDGVAL